MANIAQLAKAYGHLRDVKLDNVENASLPDAIDESLLTDRMCGHPDAFDADIAFASIDDLESSLGLPRESEDENGHWQPSCCELKDAHRRMIAAAATGRGAYPPNCNPNYAGIHSVAYFDDPESRPTHLRRKLTDAEFQSIIDARVWGPSGDPQGTPFTMSQLKEGWGNSEMGDVINEFCEEAYRRWGVILYQVKTGPNGQHNIHVTYPIITGPVIGTGWFPGSDPCPGDHVNLHIDKTYTSGFQGQFGLKLHELGHTLQLYHQFTNEGSHQEPMSYRYSNHLVVGFSDGSPVFKLPKSPSVARLIELYGGRPEGKPWKGRFETTPEDPTKPPPTKPKMPTTGPAGVVMVKGQLLHVWIDD